MLTRRTAYNCGLMAALAIVLTGGASPVERDFRPRRAVREGVEFPAITDAPIAPAAKIGDRVHDGELVLGVVVDGEARAYPINMLTNPTREIINDVLGKTAIAATW